MGMNNRDERSDLRYVLTEPEDVFPLPSQNKDQSKSIKKQNHIQSSPDYSEARAGSVFF